MKNVCKFQQSPFNGFRGVADRSRCYTLGTHKSLRFKCKIGHAQWHHEMKSMYKFNRVLMNSFKEVVDGYLGQTA